MSTLPPELVEKSERLLALISSLGRCVVAFSGGVDSAVVAKAAHLSLGDDALAVTGRSESLAEGELELAISVARKIGIKHEVITTNEFANANYLKNSPDRCFHCKTELYHQLGPVAERFGSATIANGANLDDQGDFRPGMRAAAEHGVRSPLAECQLTKEDVRQLAAHWDLPVASKPATPCLSSRVVYGLEVTPERLRMIDQAEQILRSLGAAQTRVRFHEGDLARIELPPEHFREMLEPEVRQFVLQELKNLGFKYVTFDLGGLRSGSFLPLVPIEQLTRLA